MTPPTDDLKKLEAIAEALEVILKELQDFNEGEAKRRGDEPPDKN